MLDASRSDLVAAVAGAGTMGRGIVQVLAQCGARTLVYDAQPRAAAIAKEAIGQSLMSPITVIGPMGRSLVKQRLYQVVGVVSSVKNSTLVRDAAYGSWTA